MDDAEQLAMALLTVAGGMMEEAASLAPLSDRAGLAGRIATIERHAQDAWRIIAAAKVIVEMNGQLSACRQTETETETETEKTQPPSIGKRNDTLGFIA